MELHQDFPQFFRVSKSKTKSNSPIKKPNLFDRMNRIVQRIFRRILVRFSGICSKRPRHFTMRNFHLFICVLHVLCDDTQPFFSYKLLTQLTISSIRAIVGV